MSGLAVTPLEDWCDSEFLSLGGLQVDFMGKLKTFDKGVEMLGPTSLRTARFENVEFIQTGCFHFRSWADFAGVEFDVE